MDNDNFDGMMLDRKLDRVLLAADFGGNCCGNCFGFKYLQKTYPFRWEEHPNVNNRPCVCPDCNGEALESE